MTRPSGQRGGNQSPQRLPSDVRVSRALADPEWDRFVEAAPGGTYQQTSMWAQVKSVAGWRPLRIGLSCDGALVAGCQIFLRRVARFGTVGYVSHGPLVADGGGAALSLVLDTVQRLVRQERLLYLKLQPPPDSEVDDPRAVLGYQHVRRLEARCTTPAAAAGRR